MSRQATLRKLETVLESFLERAVGLKASRLKVLDGINRLDDIATEFTTSNDLVESVGDWFAQHNDWLQSEVLRPADRGRIENLLSGIKQELDATAETPAQSKIRTEIDRWSSPTAPMTSTRQKITLKRGPENIGAQNDTGDTLTPFKKLLEHLPELFADTARGRQHLLSALDEALKKAELQLDKEALILSGLTIYYLKQNGYKVQPYVARLKKAEQAQAGRS